MLENRIPSSASQPDDLLVDLVEALEDINTESPLATLNATTISDNNGGRIYL